jgi:predicted metal-dependent hydrolase
MEQTQDMPGLSAHERELANLYLETLVAKVDPNKYRLIRELLDTSHEFLEDKPDPLREPVDDVLRKSAARLLASSQQKTVSDDASGSSDLQGT